MKLIKRLDTYIIGKFIGTYLFSIMLILSIAVVFDINEKMEKFLLNKVGFAQIAGYYMDFVPYFANLFSALFVFISVIFFTSTLATNSEIIAMLASGTSYRRIMRPYMIAAAMIALFNYYLNAYVIPVSNKSLMEFQRTVIDKKSSNEYARNIQFEVEEGVIVYVGHFEGSNKTGSRMSLERFEGKTLKSRLTANRIQYDSGHVWKLTKYMIRHFDGMTETITRGESIDSTIKMLPSDMIQLAGLSAEMTTPELKEYIAKQKRRGFGNLAEFEIEYERRFARSFAAFILTAIGLSLASRKVKGGMGLHLGIGLALSFSYIMFDTISSTFAIAGNASILFAVWLPNIVYSVIAVGLYRNAPK